MLKMTLTTGFGPICIFVKEHSKLLCGNLQQLRLQTGLVDLELICEDKRIKVHKVVMASCSIFFKDQLCKSESSSSTVIRLEDFGLELNGEAVSFIVEFVYGGQVVIPGERLSDVCFAAHILGIYGLVEFLPKPSESSRIPKLLPQISTIETAHFLCDDIDSNDVCNDAENFSFIQTDMSNNSAVLFNQYSYMAMPSKMSLLTPSSLPSSRSLTSLTDGGCTSNAQDFPVTFDISGDDAGGGMATEEVIETGRPSHGFMDSQNNIKNLTSFASVSPGNQQSSYSVGQLSHNIDSSETATIPSSNTSVRNNVGQSSDSLCKPSSTNKAAMVNLKSTSPPRPAVCMTKLPFSPSPPVSPLVDVILAEQPIGNDVSSILQMLSQGKQQSNALSKLGRDINECGLGEISSLPSDISIQKENGRHESYLSSSSASSSVGVKLRIIGHGMEAENIQCPSSLNQLSVTTADDSFKQIHRPIHEDQGEKTSEAATLLQQISCSLSPFNDLHHRRDDGEEHEIVGCNGEEDDDDLLLVNLKEKLLTKIKRKTDEDIIRVPLFSQMHCEPATSDAGLCGMVWNPTNVRISDDFVSSNTVCSTSNYQDFSDDKSILVDGALWTTIPSNSKQLPEGFWSNNPSLVSCGISPQLEGCQDASSSSSSCQTCPSTNAPVDEILVLANKPSSHHRQSFKKGDLGVRKDLRLPSAPTAVEDNVFQQEEESNGELAKISSEIASFDSGCDSENRLLNDEASKCFVVPSSPASVLKLTHKCDECSQFFATSNALKVHKRKLHTVSSKCRRHKCNFCSGLELPNKETLRIHLYKEHGIGQIHRCEECNFESSSSVSLARHAKANHIISPSICCSECNKTFKTSYGLKLHHRQHLNQDLYQCSLCNFKTPMKKAWIKHMASQHFKDASGNDITKVLKCKICPFTCVIENQLKHHTLRKHTNKNDMKFRCSICDYASVEKSALEKHIRCKHTNERPFSCDICGFITHTASSISRHKQGHNQLKPYICTICSHAYADKKRLRDHMLFHSGARPYTCGICHFSCRRKDNLKVHIKRLHCSKNNSIATIGTFTTKSSSPLLMDSSLVEYPFPAECSSNEINLFPIDMDSPPNSGVDDVVILWPNSIDNGS